MQRFFLILLLGISSLGVVAQISYEESQQRQRIVPRTNSEWAQQQPYVVMISIDGFRHDYAEKFGAKNILKMYEEGASADRVIPCFPSKTFPNHISLITGLYPANHGIVSNEFYSRSRDEWYAIANRGSVQNGEWYNGKPLWVLAEEQGMLSASYFWVGSEAAIDGILPSYYYTYSGKIPNGYRTRQVLDWLNHKPEARPHFIALYFSLVDDAGHDFGPEAYQTKAAVLEIDSVIGAFRKELSEMPLPVTIVLVSDHGMAKVNEGVILSEIVDLGDSKVSWSFPPMIYQQDSLKVEAMYKQLLKCEQVEVFRNSNLPAYFNYENQDRLGDLIVMADAPRVVIRNSKDLSGGTHGYDPYTHTDMGAIFCAVGPKIRSDFQIKAVENIQIYPFVAAILGLKINEKIDGDLRFLGPAISVD